MQDIDICSLLESDGPLLTRMCMDFGAPNTLALARITDDLRGQALNAVGATAGMTNARVERFHHAVRTHEQHMLDHHRMTRRGAPFAPSAVGAARDRLEASARELNQRFAHELRIESQRLRPRERLLLSDNVRMPGEVRSTRRVGRTVIIVDLGLRSDHVYQEYEHGGNWRREALIQTAGLAASTATAAVLIDTAAGSIAVLIAATPAGWVAGLAIAGGIATSSVLAGAVAELLAAKGYDRLHDAELDEQ